MSAPRITPSRLLTVNVRPASTTTGLAGRIAEVQIPDDYTGQDNRAHRRMLRSASRALNGGTVGTPWPTYLGMAQRDGVFFTMWGMLDQVEPEPWEGHTDEPVSEDELRRLIARDAR